LQSTPEMGYFCIHMSENQPIPNRTNFAAVLILIVIMFAGGVFLGLNSRQGASTSNSSQLPADLNYQLIQEVYNKIDNNYIKDLPKGLDLSQGLIKGIVGGLNDTYSSYLTPEETKQYLNSTGSQFEGIGVQLGFNGEYTLIETVFENSPAAKAGLLPQDLITAVDGADAAGKRPELLATKIRGKADTEVKITIYRSSATKTEDFVMKRQQIDIDNIDYQDLGNGVVKINIRKFTEKESGAQSGIQVFNRQWDQIVTDVLKLSPKSIVIDLRGNPGGYVDSVKYVAEEFLQNNQIIMRELDRQTGEISIRDNRAGKLESVKVVVLVNDGSASASEILAAALQQNNLAKVVGKQTVGKGVEQKLIPISDGSMLILVFRSWLTPNGTQISSESPIKPDFEVDFEAANAKEGKKYDTQLTKALEQL